MVISWHTQSAWNGETERERERERERCEEDECCCVSLGKSYELHVHGRRAFHCTSLERYKLCKGEDASCCVNF